MRPEEHRTAASSPALAMSALGQLGRFGNQIFQYAFLRICAKASGLPVETPPWPGQILFGLDDQPVSCKREFLVETGSKLERLLEIFPQVMASVEKANGRIPGRVGVEAMLHGLPPSDIVGTFQWHSGHYRPHKDFFRSLFRPRDDLHPWLEEPLTLLRDRGRTIVAIHLRTGDYKWLPQFRWTLVVPPQWWVDWLETVWNDLDNPVLYLCSNDVGAVRKSFRKFDPLTAGDLRLSPPERLAGQSVGFYRDYHLLTQADVVGISNSSFSFSAAMLNERATAFVRPHFDFQSRFTQFDPWDADPLLFIPSTRKGLTLGYREMLSLAIRKSGWRGALSSAFLYHPGGVGITLGLRLQIIRQSWGWRGVGNFLLGRPLDA